MEADETTLIVRPSTLVGALAVAATLLALLGLVASLILLTDPVHGTIALKLFYLEIDDNVPTWFSSILLALSAFVLAIIGCLRAKLGLQQTWQWWFLAFVFVLLSIDDVARIHEKSGDFILRHFATVGGFFTFVWVLLAIPATLLLAAVLLPWFIRLPSKTRLLFGLAAVCFLAGALGLEMINGTILRAEGRDNLKYQLLTVLEECLEMAGPLIFLYAQLRYLEEFVGSFTVKFGRTCVLGDTMPEAARHQ